MKGKLVSVLIVGMCVLLATGCSKEKSSSSSKVVQQKSQKPEKATTPKDALKNMGKAIRDGDKDAFVACFDATKDQEKLLIAMYEKTSVTMKFEDAMKKEYGKDAVEKSTLDKLMDDKWLEGVEIKVDGDKATATKKGMKEAMNLVKKDGGWGYEERHGQDRQGRIHCREDLSGKGHRDDEGHGVSHAREALTLLRVCRLVNLVVK
jgi:hypothetical protein